MPLALETGRLTDYLTGVLGEAVEVTGLHALDGGIHLATCLAASSRFEPARVAWLCGAAR